jgi:hypothetical protein
LFGVVGGDPCGHRRHFVSLALSQRGPSGRRSFTPNGAARGSLNCHLCEDQSFELGELLNKDRETWTNNGRRNFTIWSREKGERTIEVADPDLGSAGVEIKGAFIVDLSMGIRWRNDLDAGLRCMAEEGRI